MQFNKLLSTAALAWSARAFLLPPDVSGEALEAFKSIPDTNNHWTAHLDCKDCPVAGDKMENGFRAFAIAAELESELVLDFATNGKDEITMGGVPIYPPEAAGTAPFTAKQILKEGSANHVKPTTDDLTLSTRVEFGKEVKLDETGTTGLPFQVEILGFEGEVVHVDTVTFTILRDQTGHVYISDPQTVPSNITPMDAQCTTTLCRVKAQMIAKLQAAKAKMGAIANTCMRKMGFKPKHHGGHKHPHHGPHGRPEIMDRLRGGPKKFAGKFGKKPCPKHGFMAKVAHMFARFTHHVLMPVMVGIAAGMAVSAFGMVVGQIVFMIWVRVKGRRQETVAVYHIIENSDAEAALEDEPLPVYAEKEDLPEYTEEKTEI